MLRLEALGARLQDSDCVELNGFEDSDLAMYPAIEIPEVPNLTADQCEKFANYLISCIERGESDLIAEAARAMPVLAYNCLMASDGETLFFHMFSKRDFTEDWLRTSGISQVDLHGLTCERLQPSNNVLRLVHRNTCEQQRKASIGVWAFCHLRSFLGSPYQRYCELIQLSVGSRTSDGSFKRSYGFHCAYEFPRLRRESYELFSIECAVNKPGELLYLFYRGAIILERIFSDRSLWKEHSILHYYSYGGWYGFRYGGLRLRQNSNRAAKALGIPVMQLFNDLEWALNDARWKAYAAKSLKVVDILRQFYLRYEDGSGRSRYYMYTHVVNHHYFYFLGHKSSQELSFALEKISSGGMQLSSNSPYERWAVLIARKILHKYQTRW